MTAVVTQHPGRVDVDSRHVVAEWTRLTGAGVPGDDVSAADREVDDQVEHLALLLGCPVRLARLDGEGLRARVAAARRLAGMADAALAAAVGALDEAGGVAEDGAPTPAEWVKAHTGRSGREAARTARLADGLADRPATAAALAAGTVTAESADAIVRATAANELGPDAERDLVATARHVGPEQLRRHIAARRHAQRGDALLRDEQRQHVLRDASLSRDAESGMWDLRARLPDEGGTRLRTALDAFDVPTKENKGRPGWRMADALDALATAALDHDMAPATGGVARPHLTVLVDAATIAADLTSDGPWADGVDRWAGVMEPGRAGAVGGSCKDGTAEPADVAMVAVSPHDDVWASLPAGQTAWGGVLSPQAVRRLACDAAMSRVVMAGRSMPLDVGRTTREWSGPQRRAVHARDRGCRGPSCDRPIGWTQLHHIQWWRDEGPTDVANGLALCHHCHRLVHDNGWTVTLDHMTAAATWTSPKGRTATTHPMPLPHHAAQARPSGAGRRR